MSASSQIALGVQVIQDSSENAPERIGQSAPKSMAGKYDGRRKNGNTKARKKVHTNLGRKPNWAKHLKRNDASKILNEIDAIAAPSEIYKRALGMNMLALCWQIRERVEDRLLGRPFVAENPNAKPAVNVLNQDNRLQIAIQQLVPAKATRKSKKTQVIQANVEAKQLSEASDDTSNVVEGVAQVVDSTQDGVK